MPRYDVLIPSLTVNLVSLPVMVTIGLVLATIALFILEFMKCWAWGRSHNNRYYRSKTVIVICTILLYLAGKFYIVVYM